MTKKNESLFVNESGGHYHIYTDNVMNSVIVKRWVFDTSWTNPGEVIIVYDCKNCDHQVIYPDEFQAIYCLIKYLNKYHDNQYDKVSMFCLESEQ